MARKKAGKNARERGIERAGRASKASAIVVALCALIAAAPAAAAGSCHRGAPGVAARASAGQSQGQSLTERLAALGVVVADGALSADAVVDAGAGEWLRLRTDGTFALGPAYGGLARVSGTFSIEVADENLLVASLDVGGAPLGVYVTPDLLSEEGVVAEFEDPADAYGLAPVKLVAPEQAAVAGSPVGAVASPVPIPVPLPPKRGRKYCVCIFKLPDGTHDFNTTCSVFDCDLGSRCQGDAGQEGATGQGSELGEGTGVAAASAKVAGRCQWYEVKDDSGDSRIALLLALLGLGLGLVWVRRARRAS